MIAFKIWFGFQLFFEFSSVFLESIFKEKLDGNHYIHIVITRNKQ